MKERTLKTKLLTVLLTLCLALSIVPITVFADSGAYAVKFYPGDYGTMTKNDQIPFVYIPAKYTSPHGVRLSAWATVQRMKKGKGELSAERISKLDAIGFPWKIDRWEQSYALAKAYVFHQ